MAPATRPKPQENRLQAIITSVVSAITCTSFRGMRAKATRAPWTHGVWASAKPVARTSVDCAVKVRMLKKPSPQKPATAAGP